MASHYITSVSQSSNSAHMLTPERMQRSRNALGSLDHLARRMRRRMARVGVKALGSRGMQGSGHGGSLGTGHAEEGKRKRRCTGHAVRRSARLKRCNSS